MSDIGPSANRRFAFLQPTVFVKAAGSTAATDYTVPAGKLAIVLGVNAVFDGTGTNPAAECTIKTGGGAAVQFWFSNPAGGTAEWVEPHHVFAVAGPGDVIEFLPLSGTWDIYMSGILMPL